jgi:alkylation response protein AidB-like acyl-CoA dehydrogenase
MNAVYTTEQDELRDLIRDFLESKAPVRATRDLLEAGGGWDPKVWKQLAEQLDLVALAIPVEHGGHGLGVTELAIVAEEMGGVLYGGPYLSTAVLAVNLLVRGGDVEACERWLPRIGTGEVTASVVIDNHAADPISAAEAGGGWTLNGTAPFVADGATADLILVPAVDEDGRLHVFVVERAASGVTTQPMPVLDLTRGYAEVVFDRTPAELLDVGDVHAVLDQVETLAHLAVAAEQVGGATRVLAEAVDYAKMRVQFGRPIGSFQAVKHACADMLVQVSVARELLTVALAGDDPAAVSMAKSYVCGTAVDVVGTALQLHGGIGYTWESGIHAYLKRAALNRSLFGSPRAHRRRLAVRYAPLLGS